jgi:predicted transcriptional regulator
MKPPCERIAKNILPTIRSAVVSVLYTEYDLTQTEIAERMGITQASVNQYIQKTRAKDGDLLHQDPEIEKKLQTIASLIVHDREYLDDLCELCRKIYKKGILQKV